MAGFGSPSETSLFSAEDAGEDVCSICLEPFSSHDPATVTRCRHEYHLQCILDWSQRSKECPICWQTVVLKDPVSQELLAALEIEKNSRTRTSNVSSLRRLHLENSNFTQEQAYSDGDFDERILQHLAAVATDGVHQSRRRNRHRTSRLDDTQLSNQSYTQVQRTLDTQNSSSTGDYSESSLSPVAVAEQPILAGPLSHVSVGADIAGSSRTPFSPRFYTTPPDSPQRSRTSEILSFSDSLKIKLSAASSRYKESISKSTKGLKEKLMAHNNSVKELSKEVQREVTAGVTRIIERLDPAFKRTVTLSSSSTQEDEGDSEPSHGGKLVQEPVVSNSNINGNGTTWHMIRNRSIHASSSVAAVSEGHVGTSQDQ